MDKTLDESVKSFAQVCKWIAFALVIGAVAGTASAAFLQSLEWATRTRESHIWLIALLPVAGFLIGWLYYRFGQSVEKGNELILEQIENPRALIPARMTPLVFLASIMTHLFGGSAGREGVAIQMGASLADQIGIPLRLSSHDRRIFLMAGMSAGFASIFGTPLAGAVFGLEVLAIGRMGYAAIFPCFMAALVGFGVTNLWGVHHTVYTAGAIPALDLRTITAVLVAGALFGITAMSFARLTHGMNHLFRRGFSYPPLRLFVGGTIVALAVWVIGSTRYVGLGIPQIVESFFTISSPWDFFIKMLFTAVTLGAGFKGGEVTPLFFIGATLGSALSPVLGVPVGFGAAIGFAAVFAGASNTPIACTFLAIELFGAEVGTLAAIACVTSYMFSGHRGIYHSQRVGIAKIFGHKK